MNFFEVPIMTIIRIHIEAIAAYIINKNVVDCKMYEMCNLCGRRLPNLLLCAAIERCKINQTALHPESLCFAVANGKIATPTAYIPNPNSPNRVGRNRWLVFRNMRCKSFAPTAIIVRMCLVKPVGLDSLK